VAESPKDDLLLIIARSKSISFVVNFRMELLWMIIYVADLQYLQMTSSYRKPYL